MTMTSDPLTTGAPRVLRRLEPPASPWPAGIVRTEAGTALAVAVTELSDAAFGPPAEHVARPQELFRSGEGHLALMSALERPLRPAPLPAGAAVTLAVSVLRGVGEAGPAALGEWWLTPDGMPCFAPVREGEPAAASGAALLRELTAAGGSEVFAEVAEDLADLDEIAAEQWEQRLFEVAEPAPLSASAPATRAGAATRRRRPPPDTRPGSMLLRAWDAGWAATISDAGTALWRFLRGVRIPRRVLVVGCAAAAAALVLAVGWGVPESDDGTETASAQTTVPPADEVQAGADASDGTETPEGTTPAAGTGEGLAAIAQALLARLRDCRDEACRAGVLESPGTVIETGAAWDAEDAAATVVDDLGGIGVVRLDAADTRSQIVLIVARDDSWLVRDVYDVADQP